MPFEKWIQLQDREESVARVARRILQSRMEPVVFYLGRAARKSQRDAEAIHQLRVWCRRCEAALKLCRQWLPGKQHRKLKKEIRNVRRVAGAIRDLDVLRIHVRIHLRGEPLQFALDEIDQARRHILPQLRQLHKSLDAGRDLRRRERKCIERLKQKRKRKRFRQSFGPWCSGEMADWVTDFSRELPRGAADLHAWHRFRIAGKRLRYAWEIAAGVAPLPERKRTCQTLAQMQVELGDLNDAFQRVQFFRGLLEQAKRRSLRSQLKKVLAREEAALDRQIRSTISSTAYVRHEDDMAASASGQFASGQSANSYGEQSAVLLPVGSRRAFR